MSGAASKSPAGPSIVARRTSDATDDAPDATTKGTKPTRSNARPRRTRSAMSDTA